MTEQLSRLERRKAETRREILDAALDCFAEHGYHATGIGDIAERVGVAHGTFYLYFENKRDLVDKVLDDLTVRITHAIADTPAESADSLDDYKRQTERITDSLTAVITDDPRAARFLLLHASAVDQAMANRVFDLVEAGTAMGSAYLKRGVDAGYFRDDLDVDSASRAINGMLLAAVILHLRDGSRSAGAKMTRAIREIIYGGLRAQ